MAEKRKGLLSLREMLLAQPHLRKSYLYDKFNANMIPNFKYGLKRQNKGHEYAENRIFIRDSRVGKFKVSLIKNTACKHVRELGVFPLDIGDSAYLLFVGCLIVS